jgi:two-component system, cell cycle response regulator
VSVSEYPKLFDDDGEGDRTVLVRAPEIRDSSRASARVRHLLVRIEGESLGQVTLLRGDEIIIGRGQGSTLCIPDSGVSRRHARLSWSNNTYILEDLGSANGSYVGGQLVDQKPLADGDVIQLGPSIVFRYSVTDADQQAMLEHLYDASVTDALTGTYKRDYFDSRLASEIAYARRHNAPLSLIILDVDHFKLINDRYGHRIGDQALVSLARATRAALRTEDVFCRYGGEEFAVILRTTDVENAGRVAERIRVVAAEVRIESDSGVFGLTISLGCASLQCCEAASAEALIGVADRRLYSAKHSGRNRVVSSD